MKNHLILIAMAILLAGCGNDVMYTMYRNGLDLKNPDAVDESARYYIASFNEPKDLKYNQANCMMASEALNKEQIHYQNTIHSKIKITYWCEKGEYKK
jgi:hypothetical protein